MVKPGSEVKPCISTFCCRSFGPVGVAPLRGRRGAARLAASFETLRIYRSMDVILVPLAQVLFIALDLYSWVVIIYVVMSWLTAFNVINTRNRFVAVVQDALGRIVEPVLSRIRAVLPNFGGVDLSPIALFLIIYFIRSLISQLLFRYAAAY